MLANANPKLNEASVDRATREVIAICAKDGVPYGELNSLVGFMRALNDNKQFAMHFWSLVSRLSQQPHDAGNPEWLLGTIVEGITAKPLAEVREAGPAHRVLVTRLAKMLAGEDIQEAVETVPEVPAPKVIPRRRKLSEAIAADAGLSTPAAHDLTARQSTEKTAHETGPIVNAGSISDDSLRLLLRNSPVITELPEARSSRIRLDHGPDIAIPLSSYAGDEARSSSSRNLLIGVAAVVFLGVCGFGVYHAAGTSAFDRLGASVHAGYNSAVATWKGEGAEAHAPAAAPVTSAPAAAQPASPPVQQQPAPAGSAQSAETPLPPSAVAQPRTPAHRYYYHRPSAAESMAATAAIAEQQRQPEPPAKVIPIPDVTTATPAPAQTGTAHPEQPSVPSTPSGGATGVSNPPSMEQP